MKNASLDLTNPYIIQVIPTTVSFRLLQDLFIMDGAKLCEVSYDIIASKYAKDIPKLNEDGTPVVKSGKVQTEKVIVDFETDVLFDSGSLVIPFSLYVLIESFRSEPTDDKLAEINTQLALIQFKGSLANFKLAVTNVQ